MTRRRGRSRVCTSALMPITVRGRVAVATRTRSRGYARIAVAPCRTEFAHIQTLCARKSGLTKGDRIVSIIEGYLLLMGRNTQEPGLPICNVEPAITC